MADVLTIRQTVARAKDEGLGVSEYALRDWIRTGKIPCVHAGVKQLVYYPNLIRFIQNGDGSNAPETLPSGSGKRW